jgi:hypothetical protein
MQLLKAKHLRGLLFLVLFGVASAGVLVFGQGTNGSLTGQVSDPSGAAIPGATVTLTNVDTNYPQKATSDSVGAYLFKLVPPGNYTLTIESSGFAGYNQKGIVINANMNATQNVHLSIATAKGETVNVTADAEMINTTSAELGTTVNEYSVTQLPLNGRDPSNLVLLAPGMISAIGHGGEGIQGGFSFPTETAASANGGRQGSTYYMLDGVSNMDNYTAATSPMPNPDATQEFRLISNNYGAQYGFSSGGVVSIATKSGTNQFHGGVFEFLRNQDLNAKSWFQHQLDPLKKNVFGGAVGGPIFKDKLFFFGSYQGTRQVGQGASAQTHTPTAQMMNGDFSGFAYENASLPQCQDPTNSNYHNTGCGWLNGPFQVVNGVPNQLIGGTAALDPVAVQMTKDGLPGQMQATTTSTASLTSQDQIGGMYYNAAALKDNYDEYTGKLDYDLSKSQRLTLRSFIDKFIQPSGDVPGNVLSVLNLSNWNQGFGEQMYYYNEVLQHTWTVNSNTVNTASILWNEQSAHNSAAVVDHQNKAMCWSRYINVTEMPGSCYMEGAYFGGANGGWTEPSQEVRRTYGLSDTFIKTVNRHTISAGMDLMHQWAEENTQYPTNAIISFGGGYTGQGLADWLLGYMSSFEQGAGEIADIKGWQVDPYLNDEYRVFPGMTLTAGVRWDPDLAPTSVGGRGAAFVSGQQSTMFPNAPKGLIFPGDTGMNAQLRPTSYGYWEPRIGVAYQPKNLPRTSFHAGFGLFTGPVAYSSYNHVADVAPFSATFNPSAPSSNAQCYAGSTLAKCAPNSGQNIAGYMNFHNPWQTSGFGTGGVSPFPTQVPFASTSYKPPSSTAFPSQINLGASFARDFKAGITQSWNFSVEQQVSPSMAFRLAYVGSESFHQSYIDDMNPGIYSANQGGANVHGSARALTSFQQILQENSDGTASYHSLQINFDRHMAHGFQAQSAFTWQKTIDLVSNSNISFNSAIGDPLPGQLRWNRGVSSMCIPFTSISNFIYQTPNLRGKSLLMREVLGGWELSSIIAIQSGGPFGIGGGNNRSLAGDNQGVGSGSFEGGDRADRVSGQSLNVRKTGRSSWLVGHPGAYFNTAAFQPNADGTFGNSGKNIMYAPPSFNVDSAVMKNWTAFEHYSLQFRFELFNAFNHPVMGTPDTGVSDGSNFGKITGTANAPRVGQAALKFNF